MPMLLRLSDIYLRNPGTVEMHTLRGQVHKVIPPRVREYSSYRDDDETQQSLVLTVILKDMPGVVSSTTNSAENNNKNNSKSEPEEQNKTSSATAPKEVKKPPTAVAYEDDDEDEEFSFNEPTNTNNKKNISVEPIVIGGGGSAAAQSRPEEKPSNIAKPSSSSSPKADFVRVYFYDDWATALSFASAGDVLELRTSWHVFVNPESGGKHLGEEHLVTTTERTVVSVYSKSDQDIIELCYNKMNLKASEPLARVAKGIKF